MQDTELPIAKPEPGDVEHYLGWRIAVGTELPTLTRVSPTRAEWSRTRADGAPARPPKVTLYIVEDGAEKCVGTAAEPVPVYEPAADTLVEPVALYLGNGLTDWTAHTPTERTLLLTTIDKVNAARLAAGLAPIEPIEPEVTDGSASEQMVQALTADPTGRGMVVLGQVDEALAQGVTVYVLDTREGGSDVYDRLRGLPGVAVTSDGVTFVMPKVGDADVARAVGQAATRLDPASVRALVYPHLRAAREALVAAMPAGPDRELLCTADLFDKATADLLHADRWQMELQLAVSALVTAIRHAGDGNVSDAIRWAARVAESIVPGVLAPDTAVAQLLGVAEAAYTRPRLLPAGYTRKGDEVATYASSGHLVGGDEAVAAADSRGEIAWLPVDRFDNKEGGIIPDGDGDVLMIRFGEHVVVRERVSFRI